jgi:DNA-binding response OmpR family regulator
MSTILIIEQEFLIRHLLMKVLGRAGYRAQGVASRTEALAILQTQPVHLILSDWQQSDRENHALCQEIRQVSAAPILMLASSSRKGELQHCLDLGVDEYIVKPFSLTEVRSRVRRLLTG